MRFTKSRERRRRAAPPGQSDRRNPGALPRDEYLRLIDEAGFAAIDIAETKSIDLPNEVLASHLDDAGLAAFRSSGTTLQSITVRATKPA